MAIPHAAAGISWKGASEQMQQDPTSQDLASVLVSLPGSSRMLLDGSCKMSMSALPSRRQESRAIHVRLPASQQQGCNRSNMGFSTKYHPPHPSNITGHGGNKCNQSGVNGSVIAGGIVGALAGLAIIGFLVYWFWHKRRKTNNTPMISASCSTTSMIPDTYKISSSAARLGYLDDQHLKGHRSSSYEMSSFQRSSAVGLMKYADAMVVFSDAPAPKAEGPTRLVGPMSEGAMGREGPVRSVAVPLPAALPRPVAALPPPPAPAAHYQLHSVRQPATCPDIPKMPVKAIQHNYLPAGPLASKWKAGALAPGISLISEPYSHSNSFKHKVDIFDNHRMDMAGGWPSITDDKPRNASLDVSHGSLRHLISRDALTSTALPIQPVMMFPPADRQHVGPSSGPQLTANAPRLSVGSYSKAPSSAGGAASQEEALGVQSVDSYASAPSSERSQESQGVRASVDYGDKTVMNAVTMHLMESLRIQWDSIKLGEVLGEGGFGKVYKGMWRANRVGVKMLDLTHANTEAKAILHQEALMMSQLRHPNIAMVYGVVDEGPHQAIVMQFYKQGTLAHAMRTNWFLNLDEAARLGLAYQVADGMRFLHERTPQPVIHGDLKTSNLLLGENCQRVFIADFGLACKLNSPSMAMQMGALTASISPPEVLSDPMAPRAASADVYAFSIVLSEMMQGYPAFRGMNAEQIKEAVCAGNRPTLAVNINPRVRDLIQACWAQDPAARPTFADIATKLEEAISEVRAYRSQAALMAGLNTRLGNRQLPYYY